MEKSKVEFLNILCRNRFAAVPSDIHEIEWENLLMTVDENEITEIIEYSAATFDRPPARAEFARAAAVIGKRKKFIRGYGATFGKIQIEDRSTAGFWFAFIDRLAEQEIIQVLDIAGRQWDKTRLRPPISFFQQIYQTLRREAPPPARVDREVDLRTRLQADVEAGRLTMPVECGVCGVVAPLDFELDLAGGRIRRWLCAGCRAAERERVRRIVERVRQGEELGKILKG